MSPCSDDLQRVHALTAGGAVSRRQGWSQMQPYGRTPRDAWLASSAPTYP